MTTTSARICDCGTGPNVARCRDGHLERTRAKPRGRTACPHRAAGEVKCGQRANVLAASTLEDLLGPDDAAASGDRTMSDDLEQRWAAEDPPASWRELLAEPSGGLPCGNVLCPCDDPPICYTPGHTAEICPSCGTGEGCWDISPTAYKYAQEHAELLKRRAARSATASPAVPQRELDRQARELKQRCNLVLAVVRKVLADPHLTGQCRSDFEWFEEQLVPGINAERLAELEEQLREQPVNRRGWWRRTFGAGELRDYLEWAAEGTDDDEPPEDAEDQAEVIEISSHRPIAAIEQAPVLSGSVLCELCHGEGRSSFAVVRVRSNVPSMVPERDVCPGHFRHFAEVIEPMTFGDLVIVKRYGTAPGIRSIIRTGVAQ